MSAASAHLLPAARWRRLDHVGDLENDVSGESVTARRLRALQGDLVLVGRLNDVLLSAVPDQRIQAVAGRSCETERSNLQATRHASPPTMECGSLRTVPTK